LGLSIFCFLNKAKYQMKFLKEVIYTLL